MPNYLGTATGNTGIPSLLISTLQQVTDPNVQKALYQIQNWANSFVPFPKVNSENSTPMAGSFPSNYAPMIQGSQTAVAMTAGGGTLVFDEPYQFVLQTFVAMIDDATAQVDTLTYSSPNLAGLHLAATLNGSPPTGTLFLTYIAIGQ